MTGRGRGKPSAVIPGAELPLLEEVRTDLL